MKAILPFAIAIYHEKPQATSLEALFFLQCLESNPEFSLKIPQET